MMNNVNLRENIPFFDQTPKDPNNSGSGLAGFANIDRDISKEYEERVDLLNEYLALAENPADISDETRRVVVFAKLSFGLRKAGEALAWATYHQKVAYAERKNAEAVAALDEYSDYVNQKKANGNTERATNEMRNYFVYTSANVMKANKREALVNAIYEHISTIRSQFMQAISTMRSVAYGTKDSSYMSGAAVHTGRE